MTQDITKEVLALSIHVAAAASQITIQTQERMNLVTKSVLDTAEQTLKMIHLFMMNSQKHSHLEAVQEEKEDEYMKDSKTKECYIEQQQQAIIKDNFNIEVIDQCISNENCHPNISLNSTKTTPQESCKSLNHSQIQEERIIQQNTPIHQKKQSILSQQLSQIKIDKVKEAEEQRELLKIIESVDPEEMIPKLKSIEIFDEIKQQSTKKEVLVYSDKQQIEINENKDNQLKDSPNKSEWYESSSVEYRATSYNTNESSNLDHHSYRWKSSSFGDDNLFGDCGFQFQSSVFDFPFPEDFNTNSVAFQQNMNLIEEKNQFTPKKKRLYCNNKKVPHWAENLDKVSQYQNNQQNLQQNKIFGQMKQRVLEIAKQFSDNKYQRRGSSAMWQISKEKHEKMQQQMQKLQQMQDENLYKLKVHQQESIKKNLGWAAKTQYFLTSIKKKIMNSFEKNDQKYKK